MQISPKTRSLILWKNAGLHVTPKCLKLTKRGMCRTAGRLLFQPERANGRDRNRSPNNAREVVDTLNAKPMFYIKCATTSHSQPQPMLPRHSAHKQFHRYGHRCVTHSSHSCGRHFFKEQRPLEGSDREITIFAWQKTDLPCSWKVSTVQAWGYQAGLHWSL